MIIVLDTNVWLKELALNSGLGSALRFFLKRQKAQIAVPEVVRLEVQQNLRAILLKAIDDVRTANRQLLAIFGSMKEFVLPTVTEVDQVVARLFSDLRVDLIDVPFSLESARASFMKTIQKIPPSDKSQQFKDGVLWADCLRLLDKDDVLLATQDRAFYEDHDYANGLAHNLLDEMCQHTRRIQITHSIEEVLAVVRTEIPVDRAWLMEVARTRAHRRAAELLSREGFEERGEAGIQLQLFSTEDPEVLYFKYTIELPCQDVVGGERREAALTLSGDGRLRPEPAEVIDIRPGKEELSFTNLDGSHGRLANASGTGKIVIGHRTVLHTVRHPLDA